MAKTPLMCAADGCEKPVVAGLPHCREHAAHVVQYIDGTPGGLAERREWFDRRMELLGAEIGAQLRALAFLARWEAQQDREEDGEDRP